MIADYMNHEIDFYPRTSVDKNGVSTYSTPTTKSVFFRRKQRRLTSENGDPIISDAFFLCLPSLDINEYDKIGYRSSTYEVMGIDYYEDTAMDVYKRVSLKRKS